jgi:hypothetical protein
VKNTVGIETKRKIEDDFYSNQQCQTFLDLAEVNMKFFASGLISQDFELPHYRRHP